MHQHRSRPRILLAEDDPVSASFLLDASQALPADVDLASTAAQALQLAQGHVHALWLFDANLPDARGSQLLVSLRKAGLQTPALAHTANADPQEHARLLTAGFLRVLAKPIGADAWRRALREILQLQHARHVRDGAAAPIESTAGAPAPLLWDDAAAIRALGGNAANVSLLRQLFLVELASQREAIGSADPAARADNLHRLRASCALVGATELDQAVRGLQQAPASADALQQVMQAIARLLAAHDRAGPLHC